MMRFALLALSLLCLSACVAVEDPVEAAPCQQEVYRHFDFWIGEWEVVQQPESKLKAFNSISPFVQGCAIKERYQTQSGYSGESLNWYDPQLQQWRQTWVDNAGTVLQLAGGLNEQGEMVLSGDQRRDERGAAIFDRITWTPLQNGHVIQLWETSLDQGKTWKTLFRGLYRPRAPFAVVPRQRF